MHGSVSCDTYLRETVHSSLALEQCHTIASSLGKIPMTSDLRLNSRFTR